MTKSSSELGRGQTMESHKHALFEIALADEHVVAFTSGIHELLNVLHRDDVTVIIQTQLENNGVIISISLAYESLYPGEALVYPGRQTDLGKKEDSLLLALRQAGVKIRTGFVIGDGNTMRTKLPVFKGKVDYLGIFSEE